LKQNIKAIEQNKTKLIGRREKKVTVMVGREPKNCIGG
jgi:hypothetical protein